MILATRARRAGFTLIEMLVVITVIAILLALTGVAYQKAVENQRNRSTDDLANRLQPALEAEYEAVVQQAAKDRRGNQIPAAVISYCDGDMDRAQAVWQAANLRRQFPQTFAETVSSYQIPVCPGVVLQPMATFKEVSGLSGGTADQQSAALLYLILAKKAAGGSGGFAADDLTNGMQTDVAFTGGSARVFRDAWGFPVSYQLWCSVPEVQTAPFVDVKAVYKDPLDPTNKVAGWPDTTKRGIMTSAPYPFNTQNLNRLITVWSPGKNGLFETTLPNDDLMGYRTRRYGTKGNSP